MHSVKYTLKILFSIVKEKGRRAFIVKITTGNKHLQMRQ